jgi:hypothetical protein
MFRSIDQDLMNNMNDFIPRVERTGPPEGAPGSPGKPGLLTKMIGMLAGIALLIGAVLFSAVLLVVLLLVGTVVLGWFWWQTRGLPEGEPAPSILQGWRRPIIGERLVPRCSSESTPPCPPPRPRAPNPKFGAAAPSPSSATPTPARPR